MSNQQIDLIFFTKVFKTHKQSETMNDCQDAYSFNEDKKRFAIADGASRSFFPSQWSQILVDCFCHNETPINQTVFEKKNWHEWIGSPQIIWQKEIEKKITRASKYYLQNRWVTKDPAVSTFVGIEFKMIERILDWRAMIVGDSCLFHYNDKTFKSYLFNSSDEFDSHPDYFASYPAYNKYEPDFIQGIAQNNDFFILASDALAKWIIDLKEKQTQTFSEVMNFLVTISSEEEFNEFIDKIRKDKQYKLENDDVTLMIIQIKLSDKKQDNKKKHEVSKKSSSKKIEKSLKKQESSIKKLENRVESENITNEPYMNNNQIEKTLKVHTLLFSFVLLYIIVSLPVLSYFVYDLLNDREEVLQPPTVFQRMEEKFITENQPLPQEFTEKHEIQIQNDKTQPSTSTALPAPLTIELKKNSEIFDEDYNIIDKTYNKTSAIDRHVTNKANNLRQVEMILWVIQKMGSKVYSIEKENFIHINNSVNARKDISLKEEDRVLVLKKGTKYQKLYSEYDQNNNLWYKISIIAYIQ